MNNSTELIFYYKSCLLFKPCTRTEGNCDSLISDNDAFSPISELKCLFVQTSAVLSCYKISLSEDNKHVFASYNDYV